MWHTWDDIPEMWHTWDVTYLRRDIPEMWHIATDSQQKYNYLSRLEIPQPPSPTTCPHVAHNSWFYFQHYDDFIQLPTDSPQSPDCSDQVRQTMEQPWMLCISNCLSYLEFTIVICSCFLSVYLWLDVTSFCLSENSLPPGGVWSNGALNCSFPLFCTDSCLRQLIGHTPNDQSNYHKTPIIAV